MKFFRIKPSTSSNSKVQRNETAFKQASKAKAIRLFPGGGSGQKGQKPHHGQAPSSEGPRWKSSSGGALTRVFQWVNWKQKQKQNEMLDSRTRGAVRRESLFWLLRGTRKGVARAFFDPWKEPRTAAYGIGNARFIRKVSFCRGSSLQWHPSPYCGTATLKCYRLIFSALTRTIDFEP